MISTPFQVKFPLTVADFTRWVKGSREHSGAGSKHFGGDQRTQARSLEGLIKPGQKEARGRWPPGCSLEECTPVFLRLQKKRGGGAHTPPSTDPLPGGPVLQRLGPGAARPRQPPASRPPLRLPGRRSRPAGPERAPAATASRAPLTFFAAARTPPSSPPPPASASRPGCCACSPCARRCRCGRAGTRRAPARAGTPPRWWSASASATPAVGSVCSPGTWSASGPAPCPASASASGCASCCAWSSWCAWSGTSSGSATGPSSRGAAPAACHPLPAAGRPSPPGSSAPRPRTLRLAPSAPAAHTAASAVEA